MGRFSYLQIAILGVSVVAIIVAILIFSFGKDSNSVENITVEIWGTLPQRNFEDFKNDLIAHEIKVGTINYREIPAEDFERVYVEALAERRGPDIVILTHENIIENVNRIHNIPFESLPLRSFKDTFIEHGEIFVNTNGIYAVPFLVDPMLMYWNRTLFTNEGISGPPGYWDTLMEITPKLSKVDSNLRISQSAVAMGEFDNVKNAYEIVATLLMQVGNNVVVRESLEDTNGVYDNYRVVLADTNGSSVPPAVAAINFYGQFSNPVSARYSWNRSMPNSLDQFTAGKSAIYFGFSSELKLIQAKNSDLNFDVTTFPQTRESSQELQGNNKKVVYGKIYGLAIATSAKNPTAALTVINSLTSPQVAIILADNFGLPPPHRALLNEDPRYPTQNIVVRSALMSKSFHTPNAKEMRTIFENTVESITTGRLNINQALSDASKNITNLLVQ